MPKYLFAGITAFAVFAALTAPRLARADSCSALVSFAPSWAEINNRHYIRAELFAIRDSDGAAFGLSTGSLRYTPARDAGSPPFEMHFPAELSTRTPIELRSSREPSRQVTVRIILDPAPRVIIRDTATGRLWDSYASNDQCVSNDRIGGVSKRTLTSYQTTLQYLQTPH